MSGLTNPDYGRGASVSPVCDCPSCPRAGSANTETGISLTPTDRMVLLDGAIAVISFPKIGMLSGTYLDVLAELYEALSIGDFAADPWLRMAAYAIKQAARERTTE